MWSNIHARVMEIEPTGDGRKLRVRFGASLRAYSLSLSGSAGSRLVRSRALPCRKFVTR